ncbi:MAG: phosphoribosylformylglycinamidine cyclo-ligase [Planctomycetes bacterium]|nr:phosphoribosylformylglycinamidine cyclo-ligase [Planctomycetota bacterium]
MTQSSTPDGMTYKKAGVDIDAKYAAVKGAVGAIQSTHTPGVLASIGGFGSLFHLASAGKFKDPVLVASTDGVGTKLAVAVMAQKHDTIGQCIVNHCVNDILVMGARPLFFLDYISVGKMEPPMVKSIIEGMAKACRETGCALVGGETAEMPGLYKPGDYDLAGFIVGVVERDRVLDGTRVAPGDRALGLRSSGLHTNGYSLARKICFEQLKLGIHDRPAELGGPTIGEALLAVHRPYLNLVSPLLEAGLVSSMSHITGGGFGDNIPRVLAKGTSVVIDRSAWTPPPLFQFLVKHGNVPPDDAYRSLNMGIGMVLFVRPANAPRVTELLNRAGEDVFDIGRVVEGDGKVVFA